MQVKKALIYLKSTKRNFLLTIIDSITKKIRYSCSAGCLESNFLDKKNSYSSSKFLSEHIFLKLKEFGYTEISIILRGLGVGRTALINLAKDRGLKVCFIQDFTHVAHNGCRPKKRRSKKLRTKRSFRIKKLLSPG